MSDIDDLNIVHTQSFDESAPIPQEVINKEMPESVKNIFAEQKVLSLTQFESLLKSYQSGLANKFLNPYTFSLLGLYYAYKGRLGKIERVVIGVGALAALFFIIKKQSDKGEVTISKLYDEYVAQVTPKGLASFSLEDKAGSNV